MSEQALSDVRVLDLSFGVAGPYLTKLLADYGAEVIKIEKPIEGDTTRNTGPFLGDVPNPERSGLFLFLNTNKKGITLDLESATGRGMFLELVGEVDILVESFRPGFMSSLGLDYPTLEKLNPGLVMTSVTYFGQTGPYSSYLGSELIASALGGWMYITGEEDRPPVKSGGYQADYMGGLNGFIATMSALCYSRSTGVGQQVDVSIAECVASILENSTTMFNFQGAVRTRAGNKDSSVYPIGIWACQDGYISGSCYDPQWPRFCELMDKPELASDPRYASRHKRSELADELDAILVLPWTIEHGKQEIFSLAQSMRVPLGPVNTTEDVVSDPQLSERGFFVEVEHPEVGKLTYPGAPIKMEQTPWRAGRAPLLGEHNEEVYSQRLGLTADEISSLKQQGII